MLFLKKYWILGQNSRNLNYIYAYNDEKAKKLADSKIKTKEFLSKKWINVSQSIVTLYKHSEIEYLDLENIELPFVVKPNAWYWWKWILIFDKRDSIWNFVSNYWEVYSKEKLLQHIKDIMDWFYSLSGSRDKVIIEKKIILDSSIELLWKYWLPDIRVIVFNSVPVMAMLRVPTANSKWKANLHAWACWIWIDIWTWKLTYITQFRKQIKSVPWIWDVRWIELPNWDKVLQLAAKTQQITEIWYIWCDIVLDDKVGPLLLEMNIRPWLEVQLANMAPLEERLKKVQKIKITSIEKWVRLGRDLFWGDIEEKIKNISWKKVLWTREYLKISIWEKIYRYIADIKVSNNFNYINRDFLINTLKIDQELIKEDLIKFKTSLLWESRTMKFRIAELKKSNLIIWKESLWWFLIDPFKYKVWDLPYDVENKKTLKEKNIVILKWYEEQLLKIDSKIMSIDRKLNILKFITPKNLQAERMRFINSRWDYIPKFEHQKIWLDLRALYNEISSIEIPEIELSWLYLEKKDEVINKILFLEAFESQDTTSMTKLSKKIYGWIYESNLDIARESLLNKSEIIDEDEYLTLDEIKDYINKFNHIYWINIQLKEREIWSRFSIKWDKLFVKRWAMIWKREMRSVIAHEIEGHYLRKVNGKKSKYSIFKTWTAWYLATEEWIAIYNQSRFLNKNDSKYYWLKERYYFIDFCLNNTYEDLIDEYKRYYNNDYYTMFNYIARLKRWFKDISMEWCFMKDVVYLNWYLEVKKFISNWWSLRDLYFWKICISDLDDIKKSDIVNFKTDDIKIPFFI